MEQAARQRNSDREATTISVEAAARLLGCARATLYETIRANPAFPVLRLGHNRLLIPRRAFEEWMATGGVGTGGADAATVAREVRKAVLEAQAAGLEAQLGAIRRELDSIGREGG